MPIIAGVTIDVIADISFSETSTSTDHALEDKSQITDHVRSDPITISLSGLILKEAETKVLTLLQTREKGTIFDFDYMTGLTSVIITKFDRDYNAKVKDGYAFTMELKQIKTVKGGAVGAVKTSKEVSEQVNKVTNVGRQQTTQTATKETNDNKNRYTK